MRHSQSSLIGTICFLLYSLRPTLSPEKIGVYMADGRGLIPSSPDKPVLCPRIGRHIVEPPTACMPYIIEDTLVGLIEI